MTGEAIGLLAIQIVGLGILPLVFLRVGLGKLLRTRRFLAQAYATTGTVTALDRETPLTNRADRDQIGHYGRTAFQPTFEYTGPDGALRTAKTARATRAFNFEIGSTHPILIDPERADIAEIPGGALYLPGAALTALGLGLGAIGLSVIGLF